MLKLNLQGKAQSIRFIDDSSFRNGKSIAIAMNNETPWLISANATSKRAEIQIIDTETLEVKRSFLGYPDYYVHGVRVATGDLNGDGVDEILTATNKGGGPQVRIFSIEGDLVGQFFVDDLDSRAGFNLATGDIDGDGFDELIIGQGADRGGKIAIYESNGQLIREFYPFDINFQSDIRVAAIDVNNNGKEDIIAAPGTGYQPIVAIYQSNGLLKYQFQPNLDNYFGGLRIFTK